MKIFQPIVSGSVFFPNLTSTAQSNVVIVDTSTGQLYYTASSAIGGNIDTSSLVTTSSFNAYTGSNISKFAGTASYATSASNAITSSYALNVISSSYAATSSFATNFTVFQTLTLDETLTDFAKVNSTIVGSNNLFQQATGSYTSAHGKYALHSGSNARAGEFITVWNGTNVTYYDNSTTDIGDTSTITFQSSIVTSQIQINAVAGSSGWSLKMLVTYL